MKVVPTGFAVGVDGRVREERVRMTPRFLACAAGSTESPFTEKEESLGRIGVGGAGRGVKLWRYCSY